MHPPSTPLLHSVGMPLQYPYPLGQPMSLYVLSFSFLFHAWRVYVTLRAAQCAEKAQSSSAPSRESVGTRWQYRSQPAQSYPYDIYGSALIDPHVNQKPNNLSNPRLAIKTGSIPPSKIPETTFKPYLPGARAAQKKSKASAVNSSNSSRPKRGQGQDQVRNCRIYDNPVDLFNQTVSEINRVEGAIQGQESGDRAEDLRKNHLGHNKKLLLAFGVATGFILLVRCCFQSCRV